MLQPPLRPVLFSAINILMSNINSAKNRVGRPRVDSEAVNVRLERPQLAALEAWATEQGGELSRPEAIRRILTDYLTRRGFMKK